MTSNLFPSPANQNRIPEPEKTKRRKHRDWSGATVGAIVGLAGLFCARLGQIWIGFDIFAQFWIQFAFTAIACGLGLASPRYKTLVAIVILTTFVTGYSVWPYYVSVDHGPQTFKLEAGQAKLKVASFNTYAMNSDYSKITKEILRLDPDVMTLVEFSSEKKSVLDQLNARFPYQLDCWSLPDCDFAIISKTPLHDLITRDLWAGAPFISAKLGPEFGNTTIIGMHTNRFPHQRSQLKQILAFIKYMESVSGQVVLMGDFNATPFSRITQTLAESLGFERLTSLPTWNANYGLPQLAIDHVFVSPRIKALDSEKIGEYAGSDHFPITITLSVPTK